MHVELGAMVAPLSVTEVSPLFPLTEAPNPHPTDNVGETGLARKTPMGKSSVSDAFVSVVAKSLLLIVIDSRLVWPAQIMLGVKDLATVGGRITPTRSVARASNLFE